jgi:hypothetical protein
MKFHSSFWLHRGKIENKGLIYIYLLESLDLFVITLMKLHFINRLI